eukprot:3748994-Rhodomonas_salina.1
MALMGIECDCQDPTRDHQSLSDRDDTMGMQMLVTLAVTEEFLLAVSLFQLVTVSELKPQAECPWPRAPDHGRACQFCP